MTTRSVAPTVESAKTFSMERDIGQPRHVGQLRKLAIAMKPSVVGFS